MPPEGDNGGERHRRVEIEAIEPLPLDEALSIVGEENRANIIVELGKARTTDPGASNSLRFSELMRRVDVEDSGRFNYHLDQLVGPFVKKEESGYSLRLPGQLLYEAIIAGTLTDRQTVEPFPVGTCPDCDGQLTAAYLPDQLITVECTACETLFDAMHFPARGLENRTRAEVLDAAYQRRHQKVDGMRRGVCSGCGSVVDRSLEPSASITYGSASVDEMAGLDMYAVLSCTVCRMSLVGHPTNVILTAPPVVGFFADHDRDVARENWWEDPIKSARENTEVLDETPPTVAVPFEIAGDQLRVVLDTDLQLVDSQRTTG